MYNSEIENIKLLRLKVMSWVEESQFFFHTLTIHWAQVFLLYLSISFSLVFCTERHRSQFHVKIDIIKVGTITIEMKRIRKKKMKPKEQFFSVRFCLLFEEQKAHHRAKINWMFYSNYRNFSLIFHLFP